MKAEQIQDHDLGCLYSSQERGQLMFFPGHEHQIVVFLCDSASSGFGSDPIPQCYPRGPYPGSSCALRSVESRHLTDQGLLVYVFTGLLPLLGCKLLKDRKEFCPLRYSLPLAESQSQSQRSVKSFQVLLLNEVKRSKEMQTLHYPCSNEKQSVHSWCETGFPVLVSCIFKY